MTWLLLVIAILLTSSPMAHAQEACRVELGAGWSTGSGQGRIVMRNMGTGCGGALQADAPMGLSVQDIQVVRPPQHGVVALAPPRFTYTPSVGFTGTDKFSLAATGRGRDGRRMDLRGEVTVEVSP